jgi:hypothetical protein
MIRLIAVAVAAYTSTNIDDLLLLCAFCAHPAYSTRQIVAGQFIGIGFLVVASFVAWHFCSQRGVCRPHEVRERGVCVRSTLPLDSGPPSDFWGIAACQARVAAW